MRILKHQPGQDEKSGEKETVLARMCKDSEERKKEHAQHVCDVELDEKHPHTDHTAIQTNGPHQFWVCAAEGNPMMYEWDRAAISNWLTAKEVKFGGGQDKNYALERIVRHSRNKRAKEKEQEWGLQECVSPWTRLTVAADNVHLAFVSRKPGFTVDTAYLVPGSVAEDSHFETTGNIDGAVAMIDHTFKVIAHTQPHPSRVPLSSNTY